MVKLFSKALIKAKTIDEVSEAILGILSVLRAKHPDKIIAYVAGAISADGMDKIIENSNILAERAKKVRKVHPLTFSAPDIFTQAIYDQINGLSLSAEIYKHFFRKKLASGSIDVVYLTPGWRRSSGTQDEYETAKTLGIHIIDMEIHPVWKWV